MRGKHLQGVALDDRPRIIPAHAGQTECRRLTALSGSDHPRACGANIDISNWQAGIDGSSPRMRGKCQKRRNMGGIQRIIPAHAGQIWFKAGDAINSPDHPRACGANRACFAVRTLRNGSSPRMRGKLVAALHHATGQRIIPAHAGQTTRPATWAAACPDHPRACGANLTRPETMCCSSGSSPRMRGKRCRLCCLLFYLRIIPAHAGQTTANKSRVQYDTDHPRACGANTVSSLSAMCVAGSSPRMRGKPHLGMTGSVRIRIIPAHAGQTSRRPASAGCRSDHPRACGANSGEACKVFRNFGSSPRMRGKRTADSTFFNRKRIIPAHAGQTVRFYAKTLERWTLNNWIRAVAPIFVLLFLPPVIGQNAYIERHYSNQSFSWFSKLHYASAFDLSLVA